MLIGKTNKAPYKYAGNVLSGCSIEAHDIASSANTVIVHWSHDYKDIGLSPGDAISLAFDLLKYAQTVDERFAASDKAVVLDSRTEVQIYRDALAKLAQVDDTAKFSRCGYANEALLAGNKAAERAKGYAGQTVSVTVPVPPRMCSGPPPISTLRGEVGIDLDYPS